MSTNTDSARLDYMDRRQLIISFCAAADEPWSVMPFNGDGHGPMFTGETLRSAIDAAMAGE